MTNPFAQDLAAKFSGKRELTHHDIRSILLSPDYERIDYLIDRFDDGLASREEETELAELVDKAIRDHQGQTWRSIVGIDHRDHEGEMWSSGRS